MERGSEAFNADNAAAQPKQLDGLCFWYCKLFTSNTKGESLFPTLRKAW